MRSHSEPWLMPIRRAVPCSLQMLNSGRARSAIASTARSYSSSVRSSWRKLRLSVKLPGLTRTFSTKAAHASATSGRKCTSAMSGVSMPSARRRFLISRSDSASFIEGTVSRTISQPAATIRFTCATLASTSDVNVLVIDCTTMGRPSPNSIFPICTIYNCNVLS